MGDRASISFRHGHRESVTLFSHWGGTVLFGDAEAYVAALKRELAVTAGRFREPLDRLEPETVMVDFIRHLTTGHARIKSDLYLGVDREDGDNSDNGHRVIELGEG